MEIRSKLVKKFEGKVSYAHRANNLLTKEGGPEYCWFLHGHNLSYEVLVDFYTSDPRTGISTPFADIKRVVDEEITNKWDHSLFVDKNDAVLMNFVEKQREEYNKIIDGLTDGKTPRTFLEKKYPFRVNIFDYPTSIENLTNVAWNALVKRFNDIEGCELQEVTLMETPTSGCTISKQ